MKKIIMMALALVTYCGAEAQTTTGTVSNSAQQTTTKTAKTKTSIVCHEEGGYYTCCEHKSKVKSVAKKSTAPKTNKALVKTTTVKTNTVAAKPKTAVLASTHKVVKHKRRTTTPTQPLALTTTSSVAACRMVPFQVCKINPDRRSVTCYPTTDAEDLTPSGPGVVYGPTGPMPGEVVHFKVKPIVIKGEDRGAYCKRNKDDNTTICTQPGLIVRDANGYYSYAEPAPHKAISVATTK